MKDTAGTSPPSTIRNRFVDGGLVLLAVVAGLYPMAMLWDTVLAVPLWVQQLDQTFGVFCCLALWWRRRFPVALAVFLLVSTVLFVSMSFAALIALFTVAVRRSPKVTAVIAVGNVLAFVAYLLLGATPTSSWLALILLQVAIVTSASAWGLLVRSRHQLIASLRERAAGAEVEAQLRAERSQHEARENLAREMHDALGHRLSLLSVHAGALTYHRSASPEEVARAAEVIRENAHRALQDLREVIGVLRAPETGPPLPDVVDIVDLVDETERSGTPVDLQDLPGVTTGDRAVSATVGRTLYRLIQEGLTNARKHAPGAPVLVRITGEPGDHLTVEILNDRPSTSPSVVAPQIGSGEGLRGLVERAALVGGELEHGPSADGGWRLSMRISWPA
ncbi:sensor histidine kinase [Actinoalloteichus hymeniacidonis]|uniref:histidine kinase n=1 Tax=Actinoalloteichus hymeniacidonis TaxID=340345 RepID=A0AAC9HUY6_9PSEU|nr:histidine kinase [Actinoalloteichus hymeniacidonis]AOS65015.1 Histidine kinase [Actinoalloteichus hymeniacidonis]MBB5906908.1 signal transduction histidine kinase [Actinoalloteichus hymeniacidonis]